MSEWVKCSERPIPDRVVLIYFCGDYEFAMNISGNVEVYLGGKWIKVRRKITHWMPLPQPPEDV